MRRAIAIANIMQWKIFKKFSSFFQIFKKVSKTYNNDAPLNFEVFLMKNIRNFAFTRIIIQKSSFVDLLSFDLLY